MDQNEQPGHLRFDSFELDSGTGELSKNGRRLRLEDQPASLLVLLAGRAGTLVTRAEIQEALWGEAQFVDFDHAINTAIKKIRLGLVDDSNHPRLIETLPRKGYRFIGTVERVVDTRVDSGPLAEPVASKRTEGSSGAINNRDPLLSPVGLVEAGSALLPAGVARALFVVIQVGYLALYCATLYYIDRLGGVFSSLGVAVPDPILALIIVTAMCGIAVRLYLASSVGLAHPAAGLQFQRLFPALLFLDGLWAVSPLLAGLRIGFGLALAAAAGLAYLPFSQRTLIRNIYPTLR